VTIEVAADRVPSGRTTLLRDHPELNFEQLLDVSVWTIRLQERGSGRLALCGGQSSAVLKAQLASAPACLCADDEFPVLASLVSVWPSANWFEREAFDLYGIMFEATRPAPHPDRLRLCRTSIPQGFPGLGYVEMRYDPSGSGGLSARDDRTA
jgi:NADH-quinone oxidoreductase subunit C